MAAAKKTATQKTKATASNTTKKPAQSTAKKQTSRQTSMAKKPVAKGKSNVAQAVIEKEHRRFCSFMMFFAGILFLCLTYIKGDGGLWTSLYNFQRGLFGDSVYLFAPMVIYVGYMVSTDKSHSTIIAKMVQGLIVMILISGMMLIFGPARVDGATFLKKLGGLYVDGRTAGIRGGGLLSAVIGWPLLALFKVIGSRIIISLLTILFVLMLTNLTLPQIFNAVKKPFVSGIKACNEERIERASRPQVEKAPPQPKAEKPKKDKKRIDLAKYIPKDLDTVQESPAEEMEFAFGAEAFPFDENAVADGPDLSYQGVDEPSVDEMQSDNDDELKKIIESAVADTTVTAEQATEGKAKSVFVDGEGQTTMFEEEKISAYSPPPIEILKPARNNVAPEIAHREIKRKSEILVQTLESFGVKTKIIGIHRGPAVTRYELQPAAGVKVKQITNLADDIALNLAAAGGVRIEAPIPGKAAIGVEIPNENRDNVSLRELIDSDDYRNAKSKLSFAVGKDIEGNIVMGNISTMPHMLIAGTTGSGKSVFTNSIIVNILYHASPEEVKLVLIDPKKVEFPIYNGIPHLLIPVVTDPLKAAGALGWAVNEMLIRYKLFEANGVKNLEDYNIYAKENPELNLPKKPQVVIIVDEFADLMLAAKSEVENSVMRLAQLARAAGMHLLIATQSPRVDVITGLIKANIPSRAALSVSNNQDSRVILDEGGAEKLLGRGDLLFKPVEFPKPKRIQSGFATTAEIRELVSYLKNEHTTEYSEEVMSEVDKNVPQAKEDREAGGDCQLNTDDDLIEQAIQLIVETQTASTSYLQRKLKLGFARAGRIMDDLEDMGIIGPKDGAKPRKINLTKEQWLERQARK